MDSKSFHDHVRDSRSLIIIDTLSKKQNGPNETISGLVEPFSEFGI